MAARARLASSTFRKSTKMNLRHVRNLIKNGVYQAHPLLFPVVSSQGTNISSALTEMPFRENSFAILTRSLSSLLLSITGTPSTTMMLSKPSSNWTLYLESGGQSGPIIVQFLTDFASISEKSMSSTFWTEGPDILRRRGCLLIFSG